MRPPSLVVRLARAGNLNFSRFQWNSVLVSSLFRQIHAKRVFSNADIPHEILDIFSVDELWAEKGEICKIRGPETRARLRPEIFLAEPHSGPEHSGQLADPPYSVFNLFRNYANFFSLKKKNLFWKEFVGAGKWFWTKMSTNWWNFFEKISCRRRRPSGRPERCSGLSSIEWKTNLFLLVFSNFSLLVTLLNFPPVVPLIGVDYFICNLRYAYPESGEAPMRASWQLERLNLHLNRPQT